MVAYLLRLRLDLLVGSLRGRPRAIVRTALGGTVLVLATALACVAVLSLVETPERVSATVIVLAGSALTLGTALGPIVIGIDDPLDPRRMGVFGLSPRVLPGALALAGLISMPVFALVALVVCAATVWQTQGASLGVSVVGALLAVVTTSLFARVSLALASLVFQGRRTRELSGVLLVGLLVVIVPTAIFIGSLDWRGVIPPELDDAAGILALTPLGAAWAFAPGFALGAASRWPVLLVALATIGLLWWAWTVLAARAVAASERVVPVRERAGLGWFIVLPGTPTGAVAARSLVYWLRDGRYLVNVIVAPVAAVLAPIPLVVGGVPLEYVALLPVPVLALFLGWMPHNDVAYDSTAVWMHVAGGVAGVADRLGRLAPITLIGLPMMAVAIPVCLAIAGEWSMLPVLIGIAACLFLTGLGLSSISSALTPYAVTRPGDSPFQQPQRSGSFGMGGQALVLIGQLAISSPVFVWGWEAMQGETATEQALWGGLVIGGAVFVVGVALGALAFDRRGDRIMEFAETA